MNVCGGAEGYGLAEGQKIDFEDHRLARPDEFDAFRAPHGLEGRLQIFIDQRCGWGWLFLCAAYCCCWLFTPDLFFNGWVDSTLHGPFDLRPGKAQVHGC